MTTSVKRMDVPHRSSGRDTAACAPPWADDDRVAKRPQRAVRGASTYVLANAAQRVLAFALLPLYTQVLSPVEYGRLSLVLTISAVLGFLLTAGIDVALLHTFFRLSGDQGHQRRFIESMWVASGVVALAGSGIAILAVAPFLTRGSTIPRADFVLGVVGTAVLVAATAVPQAYLRAEQRLRDYVFIAASGAITTTVLMFLLVVVCRLGVGGWLLALLLGNGASLAAAIRVVHWHRPRPFARPAVRAAFVLGIPLVPHSVAQWSLLLADRAVLTNISTVRDVGIYSLAGAISTPALIFVQAMNQAFAPSYAAAGAGLVDRTTLRAVVTMQVGLVMAAGVALAALGPCVVALVVDPRFAEAGPLIPWLVLGFVFLGLYYVPVSGVGVAAGRTKYLWPFSLAAAGLNVALLYILVPRYGLVSAAVASAAGYAFMLLGIGVYSRKPGNPVTYDWRALGWVTAAAVGTYAACTLTTSSATFVGTIERVCWVVGGSCLVFALAGLRWRDVLHRSKEGS